MSMSAEARIGNYESDNQTTSSWDTVSEIVYSGAVDKTKDQTEKGKIVPFPNNEAEGSSVEDSNESGITERDVDFFKNNPSELSTLVQDLIQMRGGAESTNMGTWDKEKRAYVGPDGMPRDWAHLVGYLKRNEGKIKDVLEEYKAREELADEVQGYIDDPSTVSELAKSIIDLRGADSANQGTWDKEKRAYIGPDGMPRDWAHLVGYLKGNPGAIASVLMERNMREKNADSVKYYQENPSEISALVTELIDCRGTDSVNQGTWDKEKRAYVGPDGMPRDWAHLVGYLKRNPGALAPVIEECKKLGISVKGSEVADKPIKVAEEAEVIAPITNVEEPKEEVNDTQEEVEETTAEEEGDIENNDDTSGSAEDNADSEADKASEVNVEDIDISDGNIINMARRTFLTSAAEWCKSKGITPERIRDMAENDIMYLVQLYEQDYQKNKAEKAEAKAEGDRNEIMSVLSDGEIIALGGVENITLNELNNMSAEELAATKEKIRGGIIADLMSAELVGLVDDDGMTLGDLKKMSLNNLVEFRNGLGDKIKDKLTSPDMVMSIAAIDGNLTINDIRAMSFKDVRALYAKALGVAKNTTENPSENAEIDPTNYSINGAEPIHLTAEQIISLGPDASAAVKASVDVALGEWNRVSDRRRKRYLNGDFSMIKDNFTAHQMRTFLDYCRQIGIIQGDSPTDYKMPNIKDEKPGQEKPAPEYIELENDGDYIVINDDRPYEQYLAEKKAALDRRAARELSNLVEADEFKPTREPVFIMASDKRIRELNPDKVISDEDMKYIRKALTEYNTSTEEERSKMIDDIDYASAGKTLHRYNLIAAYEGAVEAAEAPVALPPEITATDEQIRSWNGGGEIDAGEMNAIHAAIDTWNLSREAIANGNITDPQARYRINQAMGTLRLYNILDKFVQAPNKPSGSNNETQAA